MSIKDTEYEVMVQLKKLFLEGKFADKRQLLAAFENIRDKADEYAEMIREDLE